MNLKTIIVGVYILYWITFSICIFLFKKENKLAQNIHKVLWNGRIMQFQYFPFKHLLQIWTDKKYFRASFLLSIIMLFADAFILFLGMLLLTPLIAIHQGGSAGFLLGKSDKKNIIWSIVVALFEFGHFALASSLGFWITLKYILSDLTLQQTFLEGIEKLKSGYWILLTVLVLGNSFLEIAGPIYWNMKGALGLETLNRGKEEINNR